MSRLGMKKEDWIYIIIDLHFHIALPENKHALHKKRWNTIYEYADCTGNNTHCTLHTAKQGILLQNPTLHSRNTKFSAYCMLNTAYCTVKTAHCTLHSAYCRVQTAQCTLHSERCTVHTAQCTLHTAQCTVHSAHCTLHTAHWTHFAK